MTHPKHTHLTLLLVTLLLTACGGSSGGEGIIPSGGGGWIDASVNTEADTTQGEDSPTPNLDAAPDDTNATPNADTTPTPTDTASNDVQADTPPTPIEARQASEQVIYLLLPDRFANGEPGNDTAGGAECFDPNHPRRFHGGDLEGLTDRLSYLEELGVNTIWTTPLYKQVGVVGESCGYHGYWADFTDPDSGEVEPRLGGEEALVALMAQMKTRNIGLIFDMVVNHAGYNATLTRQRPDWFHGSDCNTLGNPDVFCGLAGLPDLAQENPDVATYLNTMSAGWIERFPVAGIRMDTVKHVPLEYLRDGWLPAVRAASDTELYIVGEYLDGSSLALYDPYLEAGFDAMFNFRLRDALVATLARGEPVSVLADRVQETVQHFGEAQALKMTNLLDNHDVPRFTSALVGDGTERARRYHLALTTLLTLPGVPQIYYGNELGMEGGQDPDNRRRMPDWAWDNVSRDRDDAPGFVGNPAATFAFTQKLLALRATHPALSKGTFFELWRPPGGRGASLYAFFRVAPTDADDHLLVLLNTGPQATGAVNIPIADHAFLSPDLKADLGDGVTLTDQLGQTELGAVMIEGGQLTLTLPALSAAIMRVER